MIDAGVGAMGGCDCELESKRRVVARVYEAMRGANDWSVTAAVLVEGVRLRFKEEAGSMDGRELERRVEVTNGALRTAWPVVERALGLGR